MDCDNKKPNSSKKGFSAPIKKAEKNVTSRDETETNKKKQECTNADINKKDNEKKKQLKPLFTSSPVNSSDKIPNKQEDINNMKDSSPKNNKHKKKMHFNVSPTVARHLILIPKKKCSTNGESLKGVKAPKALSENEYDEIFNSVLHVSEDAIRIENKTLTENEYDDIFNSVLQKTSNDPESNIDYMKGKFEIKKSIEDISVVCEDSGSMKVKIKSPVGFGLRGGVEYNRAPLQDNYNDIHDDSSSIHSEEVDDWNDMPVQQENETTPGWKPAMECLKMIQCNKKVEKQNKLKPKQLLYPDTEQIIKGQKNVVDGHGSKKNSSSSDKKGITKVISKKKKKETQANSSIKIKKFNQVQEKQFKKEETVVNKKEVEEETGTWVQCCNKMCNKWRYVQDIEDPQLVPDNWECKMNLDEDHNSCDLPEVNYDESEHILTKFTVGSIVWAKMDGYPWWPGMIEIDPDYGIYFEVPTETSMVPTQYHVTFFGDNVTRAWMKSSLISPYGSGHPKSKLPMKCQPYKRELQVAQKIADSALEFNLQDRLKKFGFAQNHTKKTRLYKIESKQDKMIKPTTNKPKKVLKLKIDDVIIKSNSAKTAVKKANNSDNSDVFSDDSLENVEYLPIKSKSRSDASNLKLKLFDKTGNAMNLLGKSNNSDATTNAISSSVPLAIKTDISKIKFECGKLLEGETANTDEVSLPSETNKLHNNKYDSSVESISCNKSNALKYADVKDDRNATGKQKKKKKCITTEPQVGIEKNVINDSGIECKNISDNEDTLILDDSENEEGIKKQKLPWKLTSQKTDKIMHENNQNELEVTMEKEMDCSENHNNAEEKKQTKMSITGKLTKKEKKETLAVQRNLIPIMDGDKEKIQVHDKHVDNMKNENAAMTQSKLAKDDLFVKEKTEVKVKFQKKRKDKVQKESELTPDTIQNLGEEMGKAGNKGLKSTKSLSVKKNHIEKEIEDNNMQGYDFKNNIGCEEKTKHKKRKASISKEIELMLQGEEDEFSSPYSKTLKKKKDLKEKRKDKIKNIHCDDLKIPCNVTEMSVLVSSENIAHKTEEVLNSFEDNVLKMEVKSDKQNKAPSRKRKKTTVSALDNCSLQKQSNGESSKTKSKKKKEKSDYMVNEQLKKSIELEVKDLNYDSDKENMDPIIKREGKKAELHTQEIKGHEANKDGEEEKSLKNKKSRATSNKPEKCQLERTVALAEKSNVQRKRTSKQSFSLKSSYAKLQGKNKNGMVPYDSEGEILIDEKLSDTMKKNKQRTVAFCTPILKETKSFIPKTHIIAEMSPDLKINYNVSALSDRQVPVDSQDKTVTGVKAKSAAYYQDQHVVPDLCKEMAVNEEDEIIFNNNKFEPTSGLISLKADVEHNSEKDELHLSFNPNLVDKAMPEKILNTENSSDDDSSEFILNLDVEEEGMKVVVESVRDFGRFGGRCFEHGSDSDPLELIED